MANAKLTSLTALTSPASGDKLYLVDVSDTTDSASGTSKQITFANLVSLTALGVTASAAELNILDGATLDVDELNILDGVTASTEDLNATTNFEQVLSATTTVLTVADGAIDFNIASHDGTNGLKLAGTLVTSSAAELNLLDGLASVLGSDTGIATGTAGTASDLAIWNADGDLVDGPTPPSGTILGTTDTQTLTNKRITKRVTTIVSNATPTVNTDNCDVVTITALAAAITSMTTNLSGTPTNFQTLIYRILDNGTGRAITWGASFQAMGTALPTTTTANKVLTVGFIYDTVDSKWGCVASQNEA